jgi:hypothetical protein
MCRNMGHTCYTERLVLGIPTCVFCEDGVACPYVKKQHSDRKRGPQPPATRKGKKPY